MAFFYQFQTDPNVWILSHSKSCNADPPLSDSNSDSSFFYILSSDSDYHSSDSYDKLSLMSKGLSSCLDNDSKSTEEYDLPDKGFAEPRRFYEELSDHKIQGDEVDYIQYNLET